MWRHLCFNNVTLHHWTHWVHYEHDDDISSTQYQLHSKHYLICKTSLKAAIVLFQVFLGQKCSEVALPSQIDRVEFEAMRLVLKDSEAGREHDVLLLDTWYCLETNAAPNVYTLNSVESVPGIAFYKHRYMREFAHARCHSHSNAHTPRARLSLVTQSSNS